MAEGEKVEVVVAAAEKAAVAMVAVVMVAETMEEVARAAEVRAVEAREMVGAEPVVERLAMCMRRVVSWRCYT